MMRDRVQKSMKPIINEIWLSFKHEIHGRFRII